MFYITIGRFIFDVLLFLFTLVFSLKKDILKIALTQVSQNLLATSMFSYKIPVIRHLNEVLLLNRHHPQISAVVLFQVN